MNRQNMSAVQQRALRALSAANSSARMQAALTLGTHPDADLLDVLVERCAVEPDFFVRDMLTWAIIQLPRQSTLPWIRRELDSDIDQARSQALHTLSKIGDQAAWPWITRSMLRDPDDEVARTAWRTAAALVPAANKPALAAELASQLGRGDRDIQLSLSRSLIELGDAITPVLTQISQGPDRAQAIHARATILLQKNPHDGFDAALAAAKRMMSAPTVGDTPEGSPATEDASEGPAC
ncbi:HEAT repeat domain-containing protein [Austwickia chelonae]|uniref:HEAT repeat domain-containing protein n=1 Tax=Austwickia chelonae TaxID=100225 RepID=UPI000E2503B4|nr:HEAT repeat domain-containing protein [Austwickia chelonae]